MNASESLELTIQRLVDNQLEAAARQEFLLQAEQQPELWRRISLAFVEEQVWRASIGTPVERRQSNPVSKPPTFHKNPGGLRIRPGWLALAALILLGLSVFMRLAAIPDSVVPGPAEMATNSTPGTRVANDRPWMLQMNDELQIPLYENSGAWPAEWAQYGNRVDPRLRQQFVDAGLDLRPELRFITGNAPDGRAFVVPVQQFRIQSSVQ